MFRKCTLVSILLLAAIAGLGGTAAAGVDPSPFRAVIANRTDRLDASSPFRNTTMFDMVITLRIAVLGADIKIREVPLCSTPEVPGTTGTPAALLPGELQAFRVEIPKDFGEGAQLISWSLTAKMGVGPSPFHVFAYESRAAVAPVPYEAPALAPALLTQEFSIVGFASPGVVVGTVSLVSEEYVYEACPAIPANGLAWKNHGQYVRCVAHQANALASSGVITTDEADDLVSAAAKSEVGKK